MDINKRITRVNFDRGYNRKIGYLVLHYVGASGGAEDNCNYFLKVDRGCSAHYFVGHNGEIWQSVEDGDIAWHCGTTGRYYHSDCRNSNSIGIELCCKADPKWRFYAATVASAVELVASLAKRYGIPLSNILRHYDITHKTCPEPWVVDETAWNDFKSKVGAALGSVLVRPPAQTVAPTPAPVLYKSTAEGAQHFLNMVYGSSIEEDGLYGPRTRSALVKALQQELNRHTGAGLDADGIWGRHTARATSNNYLRNGSSGALVKLLQCGLLCRGYSLGFDGIFGEETESVVKSVQWRDGQAVDGIVGPNTWAAIIR